MAERARTVATIPPNRPADMFVERHWRPSLLGADLTRALAAGGDHA
jgi:hypothetical protein